MSRPTLRRPGPVERTSDTGLSPCAAALSWRSPVSLYYLLLAAPVPLAATPGISVDFFSSGYLDVSVHRV